MTDKLPLYMAVRNNYMKTTAKSGGYLRCLTDADAHKWAQKIYSTYISDSNFSKFPLFLIKLDRLLNDFGASKNKKNGENSSLREDDEKGSNKKSRNKKRSRK